MKKVTYIGNHGSIEIRGLQCFAKNKAIELSDEAFNDIKQHQVIAALIKSGELQCEDIAEAVTQKAPVSTDCSKLTVEQLKSALEEKNIFFEPDAKKAELVALLQSADAE